MEVVKKTAEHTVVKKKSGRYGVKNAKGKWVNGDAKVDVLVAQGLLKKAQKAAPKAEAAEEETTQE